MNIERRGSVATVKLEGNLQLEQSGVLYAMLLELQQDEAVREVVLDFASARALDSSGIAVISLASSFFADQGRAVRVENLSDSHREALALMPADNGLFGVSEEPPGAVESMGAWGFATIDVMTDYVRFCSRIFLEFTRIFTARKFPPKGAFTTQSVMIGVNAFPIIMLSSVLMGLVLGFQGADQMTDFGASAYVANLVGVGMAREFGPLMTCIVLAGRSGSAIAAELGTMKVQEELDALRVMGLDPERYLALPRMFAIMAMGPSLTILSMVLGMLGGLLIGVFYVDMTATFYIVRTLEAVDPIDVWHGMWKSAVFSFLIGSIACFCGFRIEGGASGVGRATTRAVVMGIFMIIVADTIATGLSTVFKGVL